MALADLRLDRDGSKPDHGKVAPALSVLLEDMVFAEAYKLIWRQCLANDVGLDVPIGIHLVSAEGSGKSLRYSSEW